MYVCVCVFINGQIFGHISENGKTDLIYFSDFIFDVFHRLIILKWIEWFLRKMKMKSKVFANLYYVVA